MDEKINIFISYSGEKSRKMAEAFKKWLPSVHHVFQPFISHIDIMSSIWIDDLRNALNTADAGILCVTMENMENPWLMFEAGALLMSKSNHSVVIPFLLEKEYTELKSPLNLFHTRHFEKGSIKGLLNNLVTVYQNKYGISPEMRSFFDEQFERLYCLFEADLNRLLEQDSFQRQMLTVSNSLNAQISSFPDTDSKIYKKVRAVSAALKSGNPGKLNRELLRELKKDLAESLNKRNAAKQSPDDVILSDTIRSLIETVDDIDRNL